ncbi:SDR family oxidoreductase [Halobacterium yunchengense]|uniref:SDR family oxidoreductase n=1 Tax=Halobacterium yunchengense TaxID=3108497 RepID=UPI003009E926
MDLQLQGDAALVTASSSGLGMASARALAMEGANVVMNGRDEQRLADAVADVREDATGEVVGQPGDLTDPDDVEALVDRTVEEFGTVDHLVTSAGGPPSGPFLEKSDRDWYEAYDLLVMSVVRLVREANPHLQDGGGTVVNIASSSVKEAIDGLVLSNSVRMSVIGLEKTLSKELAPDVRVNAVLPGVHETPRVQEVIEQGVERGDYEDYEDGLEDHRTGIPVGRTGDPMELGRTVAFLSSPQAGYINGETVTIDGGAGASNL